MMMYMVVSFSKTPSQSPVAYHLCIALNKALITKAMSKDDTTVAGLLVSIMVKNNALEIFQLFT